MKHLLHLSYLLLGLLCGGPGYSQEAADTARYWLVETADGNEYVGRIVRRDERELQLRTEGLGLITLQLRDVRRLQALREDELPGRRFWMDNPQSAGYFFGPSGHGLRRGEGYYQNVWVLFNQVNIGLTDHLSIGAGLMPLFLFAGAQTPIWITPRLTFPVVRNRLNVGGGALLATVIGEGGGFAGYVYGVGTLGSRDRNLSAGVGYGYADGEWARFPAITLSGLLRYGRRGYLMTENYIVDDGFEVVVLSLIGGRQVWSGISLDYGLMLPFTENQDQFFAVPWLGLAVPLGKRGGYE